MESYFDKQAKYLYEKAEEIINTYAMIKEILRRRDGLDCGGVRLPLADVIESDYPIVEEAIEMIREAIAKYC